MLIAMIDPRGFPALIHLEEEELLEWMQRNPEEWNKQNIFFLTTNVENL